MPELEIPFNEIESSDLICGAVYKAGAGGGLGGEPISRVLPVGNMGGFRFLGGKSVGRCRAAVLYTTFNDPKWPDRLDSESGLLTYYGDNKDPDCSLGETPSGGNRFLEESFHALHDGETERLSIPPFFIFSKVTVGCRDVRFHGLAVPGAAGVGHMDDLVAVWDKKGDRWFQNYRATFTLLDCERISRAWLNDLAAGGGNSDAAPAVWDLWRSPQSSE